MEHANLCAKAESTSKASILSIAGFTRPHLGWIMASILSSIRSAQLEIGIAHDDEVRDTTEHEVGLTGMASPRFGHDLRRIPYILRQQERYRRNWRSTSWGTNMSRSDRVSEQVMRISELQPQHACACRGGCPSCQAEQPSQGHECLRTGQPFQSSDLGQSTAPPIVHEVLAASGQPLDPATLGFIDPCFGHD